LLRLGRQAGWRGVEIALGNPVRLSAGDYEFRGRATTGQAGIGGFAREIYILALEDGSLRAVSMSEDKLNS
jgi:hypothetical protein